MPAEKVEFDEDYLVRVQEFLNRNPNCKAAFISRSSGSGECSHAFVRMRDGELCAKTQTYEREEPITMEAAQGLLLQWEQRMRTMWIADAFRVVEMESVTRNARGKLPYYIKLTTKD
jgi:hypothetical protein